MSCGSYGRYRCLARTVLPTAQRHQTIIALYNLAHPLIAAFVMLVTGYFVWSNVQRDLRKWSRAGLQCQRVKVNQNAYSVLANFPEPEARFQHVHVDLASPLPPSHCCVYLLICIDRSTYWPHATPIPYPTPGEAAKAFLAGWVSIFDCLAVVTSDRGSHSDGAFSNRFTYWAANMSKQAPTTPKFKVCWKHFTGS